MKKLFSGAKEKHPDILRGGHRNPYQLENAIKSGGTVFFHVSFWLNSPPWSCAQCAQAILKTKKVYKVETVFLKTTPSN